MALDPLKFKIAIKDEATSKLEDLEKKFNLLKDKTINVDVKGLDDLRTLLSQLQHHQAGKIDSSGVKGIADSVKDLNKEALKAIREELSQIAANFILLKEALKSDRFSTVAKHVDTCAESVNRLDTAFKNINATVGNGGDLKTFISNLSETLKGVSAAAAAMNSAKASAGAKGAGPAAIHPENLRQQEEGLVRVSNALGRVREAAAGGGAGAGVPFMESINRVGERNIQTLIKEQGHIERLIEIAKKSIVFGEGHPVMGMGRLRGDQMMNLRNLEAVKKQIDDILFAANKGDQAMIRFLNTSGSLRNTPWGKDMMGNNVALLGGHFDKITHSITGTATAMRQLSRDMSLDNANFYKDRNADTLAKGLYRVNDAIKNIKQKWEAVQNTSVGNAMESSVQRQLRLLTELQQKITSAMGNRELLQTRHGYSSVINADFGNQIDQSRKLQKELDGISKAYERAAKAAEESERRAAQASAKAAQSASKAAQALDARMEKAMNMSSSAASQGKVTLVSSQNTEEIRKQIDAVGALYTQIQKLERELGRAGMAMQTISPTRWDELLRSGLYQKGVSYEAQMAKLRSEQIYPGDMKQQAEIIRENIERLRGLISVFRAGGYDVKGFEQQLNALLITYEKFAALQPVDIGRKLGIGHLKGYTGPSSAANDVQWAAMKHQAEVQEVAGEAARRHQRKLEELTNAFAQHDAQVAKSQRVMQGDNQARQQNAAAMRRQAEELVNTRLQMLRAQSADLGKLLSMGRDKLGAEQYDAVRNALRGVREEMRQIENAMRRLGSYSVKDLFALGRGNMNYTPLISNTQKLVAEKEAAARATQQLTADELRLSQALQQTTQSARGQSQILSDLKSLATQYLGVWGGQQFLHNIIEIGGQLEMQRLSIGAILQNTAQANTLFEQIKGLAVKSPFGVVQLDQMTKQLTAYGFQYHELFDMTKRLADISAATGTDVSRLALALGHVRSEAALSGYTLRQFSMGNVPLLQKLSEKLGKTTKEIREMVKGKQISYDDVLGVLKDLTNEGGMFYNMQEVISQSVKAKFKNVKDAMDIMYGEMAEGAPGDALKGVAEALMEVTKNWKDAATVLGTMGALWAANRAAILIYTKTLGSSNVATMTAIARAQAQRAAQLELATTYRRLTMEESAAIATSQRYTLAERARMYTGRQLTMEQKKRIVLARQDIIMANALALSSKKLTAEDIAKQVATGKLTATEARRIIVLSDLTATEKAAAMSAVANVRNYGRLTGVINGAALAFGRLGQAMKSMLLSPQMWFMAAITAIMELWMRNSREMEKAKEIADQIYESSQEGLKNTRTMMQNTGMRGMWRKNDNEKWEDVTSNYGGQLGGQVMVIKPVFDASTAKQAIDDWVEYIRNYAATPNRLLNEALYDSEGHARSLQEQFDRLADSAAKVANAYVYLQNMSGAEEGAINATGDGAFLGVFEDDLITDIGDYEKSLKSFRNGIAKTYADFRKNVDTGIKAARAQDKAFDEAASKLGTYAQAYEELIKNQDKYAAGVSAFKDMAGIEVANEFEDSSTKYHGPLGGTVDNQYAEMESELNAFLVNYEAQLALMGHSKEEIAKDESLQQAVILQMKNMLESAKVSKETYEQIMEMFANHIGITIDVDSEIFEKKVSEAEQTLNNLVEGDWNVPVNFIENINDAIDEARKKYKQAKEFFEKTESIRLKFGIDLKMGQIMSEDAKKRVLSRIENEDVRKEVAKVIDGLNQASAEFNKSTEASKNLGFSLEDPKDKKKGSGKSKSDKKKTGSTKTYKDPIAEEWKERIRLLKEANKLYEEWNKREGRDAALKRVQNTYGDIFEQWRKDKNIPWKDFKAEDIVSYRDYVQKIADEAQKRYNQQRNNKGQNNGKEALAVLREAKNLLDELDKFAFDEKSKEFASNISKALNDLSTRWDIFESVRNILGDSDAAAIMASFVGEDFIWGANSRPDLKFQPTRAGALQQYIDDMLFQNQFGDVVDFDKVFGMSEDQIEKYVKDMVNAATPRFENDTDASYQKRLELYRNKIEGITTLLKEWQKLQREAVKSGTNEMAELLAKSQSAATAIGKVETEYQRAMQTAAMLRTQYQTEKRLNPNGNPHGLSEYQYQQAVAYAEARREIGLKELTPEVNQFYNALSSLNRRTARAIGTELLNAYKKAFDAGLFSADEYSEKVKKVLENMSKSNGQYDGSLFDRMSRFGGWLFDRHSGDNNNAIMDASSAVRYRLANERATGESENSDMLIIVLERLAKALDNVASGAGGRAEVLLAGQLGRAVANWGKMNVGERASATLNAQSAKDNGGKRSSFDQFTDDLEKVTDDLLEELKKFQQGLEFASGFFKSLGMKGASEVAGDAASILGSIGQGASALSAFGPYGQAAGAALGLVSGIAQTHDASLERRIELLREDVQKIENNTALIQNARERTLGFDTSDWRTYAKDYAPGKTWWGYGFKSKAQRAMYEYYGANGGGINGYSEEFRNLQKMRNDQLEILDSQLSKKDKSNSEIEETKKKIAELDEQIRYFAIDLANELFSIDLKGWADQIGDALLTAFENGTSAAQAFKESTSDIMRTVVSQMLKVGILQPMMKTLEDRLFGENGAFDKANPEASMGEVLAELSRFFGEGGEGQAMMGAAESFLTGAEDLLNNQGMSLKSSSQSTQTSGIQSQATEETIGILSGQMARIAQDVSVKRIFITQLVTTQMPKILEHAKMQQTLLERQFQSVKAIEHAIVEGDGAMYESINRMSRKIDKAITPDGRVRLE